MFCAKCGVQINDNAAACPACGTLRAIHAILHGRFADAWRLNPLMIVSIPFLIALTLSTRFRLNATVGKMVALVTIAHWILRNL